MSFSTDVTHLRTCLEHSVTWREFSTRRQSRPPGNYQLPWLHSLTLIGYNTAYVYLGHSEELSQVKKDLGQRVREGRKEKRKRTLRCLELHRLFTKLIRNIFRTVPLIYKKSFQGIVFNKINMCCWPGALLVSSRECCVFYRKRER